MRSPLLRGASLLAALLPLLPVAYLVVRAGDSGLEAWGEVLHGGLVGVTARSIALASLVAATAVLVAVPYAFLVVRTDLRGRRAWAVLGALPLVIPSYVGAIAIVGAFGPRGLLQGLLEPLGVERLPEVDGFVGSWVTLTMFTYPYVLLMVAAAWRRIDRSLERAARGMGLSRLATFRSAVLPQLRSSIVAGALLVALYVLGDFGVVSVFRTNTFTREIYLRYSALFDRSGAAMLGLVLCGITFALLVVERRVLRGHQRAARRRIRASDDLDPVRLGRWRVPATAFLFAVSVPALVVPIGVLAWWAIDLRASVEWGEALTGSAAAAGRSLLASGLGAVVATALALPVALLAVRRPGPLSRATEGVVYSGYALPGLVAALGLVFFATRYATFAYQTLALLVLAYVIRFMPQSVGASRSAIERIDPALESASRGLGQGAVGTFRRVTLPLAGPGIVTGALLVLLTAMKELPATLVLRPTGFDTLATEIWTHTSVADRAGTAIPALVLVAISAVPVWLLLVRPQVAAGVGDAARPALASPEALAESSGGG